MFALRNKKNKKRDFHHYVMMKFYGKCSGATVVQLRPTLSLNSTNGDEHSIFEYQIVIETKINVSVHSHMDSSL